jgi:hypothetical protein
LTGKRCDRTLEGNTDSGTSARTTLKEYDPNGNLRRFVDPVGVGSNGLPNVADQAGSGGGSDADLADATWHATVRRYDEHDQVTEVWHPWGKSGGGLDSGSSDPTGPSDPEKGGDDRRLVQTYQRAAAGSPLARVTSLILPHQVSDDKASRTSYQYFANGWVKSKSEQRVTDPNSTAVVDDINVSYDYDQEGNQTRWRTAHATGPNQSSKGGSSSAASTPTGPCRAARRRSRRPRAT